MTTHLAAILTVYDLRTGRELDGLDLLEALDEFRRTGGMAGASFADPADEDTDDRAIALAGPSGPESVDWSGFEAALAAARAE